MTPLNDTRHPECESPFARLSLYSNSLFILGSALYVVSASFNLPILLNLQINVFAAFLFICNGFLDVLLAWSPLPAGPAGAFSSTTDLLSHPLGNFKAVNRLPKPPLGYLLGGLLFGLGAALYAFSALAALFSHPAAFDPWMSFAIDTAASHTFVVDAMVYLLASRPAIPVPLALRLREPDFWGDFLFLAGSLAYGIDSWICAPWWTNATWCSRLSLWAAWVFMVDSLVYAYAKYAERTTEKAWLGGARPLTPVSRFVEDEGLLDENF